ncbi:hypothetical protein [Mycobacterium sp. KBS0706]|nr:hypothetical protein [Mycobacterium sp. KBS0706]
MAKGQKRNNREIRKTKQAAKPVVHGTTQGLLARAAPTSAGIPKKKS